MLNYEVEPQVLQPFVPAGTELDDWQGRTYASIVGFLFQDTRILGLPIPLHTNFEEVNLRFYVRRRAEEGWRRGVVFIRELVPRALIAWVARALYGEDYRSVPMAHRCPEGEPQDANAFSVSYSWVTGGSNGEIRVAAEGSATALEEGTEEEFVTEHYWGYSKQRDGSTLEYRVLHPRWNVWKVSSSRFEGNIARLYGSAFEKPLSREPRSAFLAEGSRVAVYRGLPLGTSPKRSS
jgi:uncharacterized protein YqjF (DUF2071 family)